VGCEGERVSRARNEPQLQQGPCYRSEGASGWDYGGTRNLGLGEVRRTFSVLSNPDPCSLSRRPLLENYPDKVCLDVLQASGEDCLDRLDSRYLRQADGCSEEIHAREVRPLRGFSLEIGVGRVSVLVREGSEDLRSRVGRALEARVHDRL